jgi:hypothetical protein
MIVCADSFDIIAWGAFEWNEAENDNEEAK